METILITGANGFIGSYLCTYLEKHNYNILQLTRSPSNEKNNFIWDVDSGFIEEEAIKKADYIIHLAGAGIADKRWTKKRKTVLIESRTKSTALLLKYIVKFNPKLKAFIGASGIGAYGAITTDKIFTENSTYGNDFISLICELWEKASFNFQKNNIRTVVLRTGIVYNKNGGAFEKILQPIKLGLGAAIGTGKQYMPWIHIEDLCKMFLFSIQTPHLTGIFNAVAPEHITNAELTKELANAFHKKIWLPNIPSALFKLIFGELSCILTEGSRVSSEKIQNEGFTYKFHNINGVLNK